MRWLLSLSLVYVLASSSDAAPKKPKSKAKAEDAKKEEKPKVDIDTGMILSALSGGNADALAGSLRGALVRALPHPLYEKYTNWGKTDRVANGLKWDGLRPELQFKEKNDGKWKHLRVEALLPANHLILDIRNLRRPEQGHLYFTVFFACPIRCDYRVLTWERGLKIWDRSYRARCRVIAQLHCEATFRTELKDSFLPDFVFRLRVAAAQVNYDDFVMEHAAGLGGEAAEMMGEVALRNVKRFSPSLESDLLAKANAAIEKAADTKEVRVSMQELLKKKGWLPSSSSDKNETPAKKKSKKKAPAKAKPPSDKAED